ncbi:uncharacterized protein [Nicotiana sylvestris]|uniref:uncharacterized protein n=1 Tax=Nicotiana sylvestris TaxID=4096 RepID=UPI00388C84BE
MLDQDIIYGISKDNKGGNMVIKLDMDKAYDRLSWAFLASVMRRFGFEESWIDTILRCPPINNLAYADDILIFSAGNNKSVRLIMQQVRNYERSLGQKAAPYIWAGKNSHFDPMMTKVAKRLNGWHVKLLTCGGRMVLIKSALQSLPIYTLSAMSPPKGTLNLIEKHLARFFWGTSADKKKYHWSAWRNLCLPKEEGGIGIRSLEDISNTLSMKRW